MFRWQQVRQSSEQSSLPTGLRLTTYKSDEYMLRFGVIGYGYWGPNIVRNLDSVEGAQIQAIADKSGSARQRAQARYQGVRVTADACEVISSADIDAVAIVTPVWTHFELAKAALEHGKHIFVEKPFTSNAAQAEELIDLAARK